MSFLLLAILFVASMFISYLLRPRIPKPQTQKWERPRVELGEAYPVGFGTFEVSPNMAIVTDMLEVESEKYDGVTYYWAKMLGTLCHGPVDGMVDWRYQDQSVRLANPLWAFDDGKKKGSYSLFGDAPDFVESDGSLPEKGFLSPLATEWVKPVDGKHLEIFVMLPSLFGGPQRGGGIAGQLHIHWGTFDDVACELTKEALTEENASRFPGICYVSLGWKAGAEPGATEWGSPWVLRQYGVDPGENGVNGVSWNPPPGGSGSFAQLDGNCWGIGIAGEGWSYWEREFTGFEIGKTYTVRSHYQRTAAGPGGIYSNTTWLGHKVATTPDSRLNGIQSNWNSNAIASDGVEHVLQNSFVATQTSYWIGIGMFDMQYGETCFRSLFWGLEIIEGVSAGPEEWQGPYLGWNNALQLTEPKATNRFYFGANAPSPQPPTFVLQRWPVGLTSVRVGEHANGVACLYEMATNRRWGMRRSAALIDTAQWNVEAAKLDFGVSFLMTTERPVEDWFADVLSIIDGVVYTDIRTGLLRIKLVRNDYDPDTVPVLLPADIHDLETSRVQATDLITEVQVRYRRYWSGIDGDVTETLTASLQLLSGKVAYLRLSGTNVSELVLTNDGDTWVEGEDYDINQETGLITVRKYGDFGDNVHPGHSVIATYRSTPRFIGFRDDVETLQNQALWQATGNHNKQDVDFGMIADQSAARYAVNRLLRAGSRSLRAIKCMANKKASVLYPGAVFKLPYGDHGLEGVVFRVLTVDYGRLEDAEMEVTAAEDEFSASGLLDLPSDPAGEVPPRRAPTYGVAPRVEGWGAAIDGQEISPVARRVFVFHNRDFPVEVAVGIHPASDVDLDTGVGLYGTIVVPAGVGYADLDTLGIPDGAAINLWVRSVGDGVNYTDSPWLGPDGMWLYDAAETPPATLAPEMPSIFDLEALLSDTNLLGSPRSLRIDYDDPQRRLTRIVQATQYGSEPRSEFTDVDNTFENVYGVNPRARWYSSFAGQDVRVWVRAYYMDANDQEVYLETFRSYGEAIGETPDGTVDGQPDSPPVQVPGVHAGILTYRDDRAVLDDSLQVVAGPGITITPDLVLGTFQIASDGSGGGGGGSSTALTMRKGVGFRLFHDEAGTWVLWPIKAAATVVQIEVQNEDGSPVTATVELERSPLTGFPAFADITGGADITIAADDWLVDDALATWSDPDKALAVGDVLRARLVSTDALTGDLLVVVVTEEDAEVSASVRRIVPVGGVFRTQGERQRFTVEEDATIMGTEIMGDVDGMTGTIEVWYSGPGALDFGHIGDLTLLGTETGARHVDGSDLVSFAGYEGLAEGGTLEFRFTDIDGGTELSGWIVKQVGTIVGAGGLGGSPSIGAVPRVTGAQTLGNSTATDDGNAFTTTKGRRRAVRSVAADATTTAQDDILFVTGATAITLVAVASHPKGHQTIVNNGADDVTVDAGGTDELYLLTTEGPVTLEPGDAMDVVNDGASRWRVV